MLKIKDSVDLRTTKKYFYNNNCYVYLLGRSIYTEYKDDRGIISDQFDLLFDLIQAGLVEKVEE